MNVLLIAIDTLRADYLSCYGFERPTSPHIDRIANDGTVFENFVAPHIPTHPGFTTMFTGRDAIAHQIVTQGGKLELAEDIATVPQILSDNGYFTAAADNMGRWFDRGYDLYERYSWERDTDAAWRKGEAVNEAAFTALDACDENGGPWFCFVHYWDPHTPYLPPAPFDRMFYHGDETAEHHTSAVEMMTDYPAFQHYFNDWMPECRDVEFPKRQYEAEIAYCDTCIAKLLDRAQGMSGIEDTLIIITSDHGEELDEHEMWFDHHGMYETNLHVPLILRHPDRIPSGVRLGGLTAHQDLPVTILDLLGMSDLAGQHDMDGNSLLPLIDNRNHAGIRDWLYITENAWMKKRGFRTNKWKFIQSLYDELHGRPEFELYSLTTDPMEQNNLAEQYPDLVEEFTAEVERFIETRTEQTGQRDPQSYQDITLTQVGNVDVAVPDDQVLEED